MTSPKCNKDIEVIELDVMHKYVGRKKTTSGYGLLLIDMENGFSLLSVGTRSTKTGITLWPNIKDVNVIYCASDSWISYKEFIPAEKHL